MLLAVLRAQINRESASPDPELEIRFITTNRSVQACFQGTKNQKNGYRDPRKTSKSNQYS